MKKEVSFFDCVIQFLFLRQQEVYKKYNMSHTVSVSYTHLNIFVCIRITIKNIYTNVILYDYQFSFPSQQLTTKSQKILETSEYKEHT